MTTPNPASGRLERRKAQTRAALISAAQTYLATGATNVSIQEITDTADVGFGSFYNHFPSKDELFAAAVADALEAWGALRDVAVATLDDPAEIFATTFRMSGRLQRTNGELVRVVLNTGVSVLVSDRGLRPRALHDLGRGIETGQFDVETPEVALMISGGALLGLLQILEADPTLDDAELSDSFARRVLVMLGVEAGEARRIVALPLPDVPSLY